MESRKSRQSSDRMEHRRSLPSTENDAPNMEEVLQAISDIQSIDIDQLRTYLLESSKPVGENVMDDLIQTTKHTLESQKRETDRVRKCLQEEQEFKKEYVKAFGETKINDLRKMMEDLERIIEKFEKETNELRTKNKVLEEEKRVALEEKAKACKRLKTQMEDRMIYDNSSIAVLSDQNRPNKLKERYMALYDNQWRYAFTVLTETHEQNEENATEILLKLLRDCHTFSEMRAKQQMNDLVKSISGDPTVKVGDEIQRHLKEARKLVDVRCANLLFQECEKHVRDNVLFARRYLHEKEMKMYLIECFQLCWLMAIQDPPVVLGKEARYADAFDLEFYNHYTRSGNVVQFVVWPPLLLHKGGPVLAKGVAQPIQEESHKIFASERKYAWDIRNMSGQHEQPRGRTTERDLMLSSIQDIDDPKLWMKIHYPPTPKSTSASTAAQHFQHAGEQERNIISTRVGYDMHPIETSYSSTNVDLNQNERVTSTHGYGAKTHVITEDVLNSSQRTRSRYGTEIRGQNHADSTTATPSLRTRGTGLAYEPLQRHEQPQFRNFQIKLGLYGVDFTKSIYGRKFDRFYALYIEELQSKSDRDSYA